LGLFEFLELLGVADLFYLCAVADRLYVNLMRFLLTLTTQGSLYFTSVAGFAPKLESVSIGATVQNVGSLNIKNMFPLLAEAGSITVAVSLKIY
jgi:hypothetical protein